MAESQAYVLGGEQHELARLDAQAAFYEPATAWLLAAAGIEPGMRVLDLGSGLGHVARLLATLVGPEGEVVGVDAQPGLLELAGVRTAEAGLANVRFVEGDVREYRDERRFDAVVGRLILFHLADPVAALRHHAGGLEPGGLLLAIDFDTVGCRCEPPVALAEAAVEYYVAAFRRAGADPAIGMRLGSLLAAAGLTGVSAVGIQDYIPPGDPRGIALLAGVVRTLAVAEGPSAVPPELALDTLDRRLAEEVEGAGATIVPPTLVGAWGRAPSEPG
ncbi:MAG TPA: methyltransferase domain-containing protein [Gaiellaceae bacterium]|jgi:SAM-dependent methyltransferase